MIARNIEIALDLSRVQVHGQHTADTGLHQQVGHQLGGDGFPPRCLAVSAGIAVVRHHRSDLTGGGAAAGVHHDQQLHQVIVHRSAGGLHQKDITATDGFLDLDVKLTVGKALADAGTVRNAQIAGDLTGQCGVGTAAEQPQPGAIARVADLQGAFGGHETGHGSLALSLRLRW